ncbi:MAG: hypothetical protein RLO17_04395 [Cyclobacteriaceae bacterium]
MSFSTYILALILAAPFIQTKNEYYVLFRKIDNRVNIYMEDSLIYQSKLIDGNPEDLNLKVDISEHLRQGPNKLRVELINGSGEGFFEKDSYWEIFYEIFKNEDPIDYMSEKSSNGTTGLVFSFTHEIYIE